jgi:xanthine dehydrogenase small subunit
MQPPVDTTIELVVDGHPHRVADDGASLLEVLRDRIGVRSAKDGCAPQGQCGCCTVLVDGQPRVACVTPARRVAGRSVTTVDGLASATAWADRFVAAGASQCGFCTPGIIVRLAGGSQPPAQALLAHLCRCTGWQTIVEACGLPEGTDPWAGRDRAAAALRASIEGRSPQTVGPDVALGRAGFADDGAPADALVAVRDAAGGWHVAETLTAARSAAGFVAGRRTTLPMTWPVDVPDGSWARTLQTTWVEPAYLEPDASWCRPGGEPAGPLANGGAFGGKAGSGLGAEARRLADEHGLPVRVLLSREDVVRLGPKRPPLAAGVRGDGTGSVVVARTPGIAARFGPGFTVQEVDLAGPPTTTELRAAGWAEAAVLRCSVADRDLVRSPDGAEAEAVVHPDGTVAVRVRCGALLDAVVLRSYVIGAAHQALGWVRSEGIAVDAEGVPQDLTIRSFGVLKATQTPSIEVELEDDPSRPAVNGSDAAFAAVAAAAWRAAGYPARWPMARGS